jgi:DNA-binding SARP family transcriptional activator/tetratricopeptide (TPR) repeat protein
LQRVLLAALLVDAGRAVTVDSLLERIWGDLPPAGARHALHTYVARIRKLLGELADPPPRLVRRTDAYLLEVDPNLVDIHRFRRRVEQARDPACADADRVELLREALGLWRGEPLADLSGSWPARIREAWRGQRLDAAVSWAQAELRLGDAGAVLGPVGELLDEYPLAEPLAAVRMRALHAAGRTAEALDCYTAVRNRLVDQLGTEPGAELQEVHRAILRGDTGAAGRAPRQRSAEPVVPAQLPMGISAFAGRTGELARLDEILATTGDRHAAVLISALSGTAGVGKTALAVHWAHRVSDRFPDGQLYVNLRGFDHSGTAMTPAEAVRGFLDAFGVPPDRIPSSVHAQAGLYRSLLSGRRVLVVLDNARDSEQVRPLLPGTPTAMVVVTSRNQLPGLIADGAASIGLDLLSDAEARELLARRIGAGRLAAEPVAVDEIVERCARLPLALTVVAVRAATNPSLTLTGLAAELREAGDGGLNALDAGDASTDVRTVFSWSYHALSPAAARLFRLLGLHPGPDVSLPALASLAGLAPAEVREPLAELARAHLVTTQVPGRYTMHDLLRAYAVELDGDGEDRDRARSRMFDHYLHTAHAAACLLLPRRAPIPLPDKQPGVRPEPLDDLTSAMTWYATEHRVLLAVFRSAAASGYDDHTWRLAWAFSTYLDRHGHWLDQAATHQIALESARRTGDPTGLARTHHGLAYALTRLARYPDAERHFRTAIELFEEIGDQIGEGRTHLNVAEVYERQGRHADALRASSDALEIFRATGYRPGEAFALNAVGWYHSLLGDHEQAISSCQLALQLLEEAGDKHGQAATWDSLGHAHQHLGRHARAVASYGRAIELWRELADRYNEACTFDRLGDAYHAVEDSGAARRYWEDAAEMLDRLDHPDAGKVRAKLSRYPVPVAR